MQLADNDALGSVDNEGSAGGHVRNRTEVNVLYNRFEVLMLRVGTVQLQARLEGHREGESTLDALHFRVARGIHKVVEELQHELVSAVRNRKVLVKCFKKAFNTAVFRLGINLEKIAEGLDLDVQKIGAVRLSEGARKIDSRLCVRHGAWT